MVTKISKWSRIQDSCRITPKIESLVVYALPDTPSKFQKDPSITFWVILLTYGQTNKQTNSGKNITSLVEVTTQQVGMDCWPLLTVISETGGTFDCCCCNLVQRPVSRERTQHVRAVLQWICCLAAGAEDCESFVEYELPGRFQCLADAIYHVWISNVVCYLALFFSPVNCSMHQVARLNWHFRMPNKTSLAFWSNLAFRSNLAEKFSFSGLSLFGIMFQIWQ